MCLLGRPADPRLSGPGGGPAWGGLRASAAHLTGGHRRADGDLTELGCSIRRESSGISSSNRKTACVPASDGQFCPQGLGRSRLLSGRASYGGVALLQVPTGSNDGRCCGSTL